MVLTRRLAARVLSAVSREIRFENHKVLETQCDGTPYLGRRKSRTEECHDASHDGLKKRPERALQLCSEVQEAARALRV